MKLQFIVEKETKSLSIKAFDCCQNNLATTSETANETLISNDYLQERWRKISIYFKITFNKHESANRHSQFQ